MTAYSKVREKKYILVHEDLSRVQLQSVLVSVHVSIIFGLCQSRSFYFQLVTDFVDHTIEHYSKILLLVAL